VPGTGHFHVIVDRASSEKLEEGDVIPFDATHLHYGKGQVRRRRCRPCLRQSRAPGTARGARTCVRSAARQAMQQPSPHMVSIAGSCVQPRA
jgi:hypothetical protein